MFNATMGSTEEVGNQLLDCAIQAGCGENSKVYCVGDGAKWYNEQVRKCHRYISNRLDQFDYKSAIEANLPIGSGEIESAHRYVIQKRLKLPGAWWLEFNAENMLELRTLRENGGWDNYWADNYSFRRTACL